ncbi:Ldh family oxidoreductase [Bacillus mojavensis]|uniref:Ldh family oxidoreductase n=1 Tax=Bacillus mojavensis TaxID=72360 RepID=UPI002DBAE481|nr:Ldh family oxidoreductase [Bacillus mojavensis]MEC1621883.1 Ldh family oxidoreductase [Bacillus mojavensis]MEC1657789.1 Ldh family oxidoreductase [Bacillus mojavensis]
MNFYTFKEDQLSEFVKNTFIHHGLRDDHAETAAKVLAYADLNGFSTHGIANLEKIYLTKIQNGNMNPKAEVQHVINHQAISVLDAQHGIGLVVGDTAMKIAIEKAKMFGVGIVTVRNSSHFGSAGYYSHKALQENMLGFSMTNLGSQGVAPPMGGTINMLGTNPISVSAPSQELPPFLLDMSTTVAATGKIKEAARQGRSIPEGWLINKEGQTTTNPHDYLNGQGFIQFLGGRPEMGGNKGYGLSILVDILCGLLSGADIGPDSGVLSEKGAEENDYNVGHFFMAINIDAFVPISQFKHRMEQMLSTLMACPTTQTADQVIYPGYLEGVRKKENITVDEVIFSSLTNLSKQAGISIPEYAQASKVYS